MSECIFSCTAVTFAAVGGPAPAPAGINRRGALAAFFRDDVVWWRTTPSGDARRRPPSRASRHTALFIFRPGTTPATTLRSVQPVKIGLYNRHPSSWLDNILWKYITVTGQKIHQVVESVSYGRGWLCEISRFARLLRCPVLLLLCSVQQPFLIALSYIPVPVVRPFLKADKRLKMPACSVLHRFPRDKTGVF